MNLNDFLTHLKGVKKLANGEYLALCPAHDDHNPSLSVKQDKDRILLHCKAGCKTEDVCKAMGLTMADLFLDGGQPPAGNPIAVFYYQNPDGGICYVIKRFPNLPDGEKVFVAYMPDGIRRGIGDTPKILYRAPEVIKAKEKGETIFITEGEKDAETLRGKDLVATTPPFGANSKWLPEYTDLLKGAKVVILPDTDPPGLKKGKEIAVALQGRVASLKLLELEGAKDVTEWIERGGTRESLLELEKKTPEYHPTVTEKGTAILDTEGQQIGEPAITSVGNTHKFNWPPEGLEIVVSRLSEDRHHVISGEIDISLKEKILLGGVRLNLQSARMRSSTAKELKDLWSFIDWAKALGTVCQGVLERFRKGEPVEEIWPNEDDTLAPEYLLEPILYLNHPAVIFGDYASGKSLCAQAIAYLVQLPFYDNELSLITRKEPTPCLYLDYEDNKANFNARWSALERGFQCGTTPIFYRRMSAPIADDLEELGAIITSKNIGLVIVDSLGLGAGGNLNEAEPAIRYNAALRQLNVTSLTLAHNAKDSVTNKRTIFGSIFFTNLARSVWECKGEQESDESELIVSLKQTKASLSRPHPAMGFSLLFENNAIKIQRTNLEGTALSGELPLWYQIRPELKAGAKSVRELAEILERPESSIQKTLKRKEKKGIVIKVEGGRWGLKL